MRTLTVVDEPAGPALVAAVGRALEGGPAIAPLPRGLPPTERERLLAALRPDRPVDPSVALVVATSGSTGTPKGVELTVAALEAAARASIARLGLTRADRWLACLPLSSIGGLQVLVRSRLLGTDPIVLPRFDVEAVERAVGETTVTALVPTMLVRLLDARVDLSGYRHVLLGGAAASPSLLQRASAAGVPVTTTYGMTETCGGCVYDGTPLDGVEVTLDGRGRVVIRGPVLARAYREGGRDRPLGDRLVTEDLGRFTADGRLEVLGRADDVIVTGGRNVVAARVAALLAAHPAVAEAAVVGRQNPEWGELVVAVVVPVDPAAPPHLEDLREFLADRAARHEAPRELVVTDRLPLLPSGKVDRLALRAP